MNLERLRSKPALENQSELETSAPLLQPIKVS